MLRGQLPGDPGGGAAVLIIASLSRLGCVVCVGLFWVVYSLYKSNQPKPKIENPGSLKSISSNTEKDFISEEEYEKMSREEVRKNMALIEKSMPKL